MKMGIKEILVGTALLSCWTQSSQSLRILGLFPINAKSHFIMFEVLAKGLAAKGHQVDVYSQFPLKKPVANYTDYSLEGSMRTYMNNMTYEEAISYQSSNIELVVQAVGNPVCDILSHPKLQNLIKNPPQDPPYDLVIVEVFLSNCNLAWGRFLNIPMVGVSTNSMVSSFQSSLGTPNSVVSSSVLSSMTYFERLITYFITTKMNMKFDYYLRQQDKYIEKNFGSGYPDPVELQKDIDLLLINQHYSLHGIDPFPAAIVPVAGLHIKDDNSIKLTKEVQKWLDESKSGCIYVSFGSMVRIETFPEFVVNALYASFKNIAPTKILMKIARPQDLLPGLPANVMIQSWLSQEEVLKHENVKLFITHGGLMGTLESIYYRVPMIGIPIFGDQIMNVENNVRKGISKFIDFRNITEDKLTSSIKEIMYNPVYKQNVEKISKIFTDRPMKPLETAVYWIEYVGRNGKGCLRSALVDIPWWQASLLDIYGFCVLVILGLLYVVNFVVVRIYNYCCSARNGTSSTSIKSKKFQ